MESIIKKIHNALCSIACCLNFKSPDFVRKIIFRYLSVPLTDDFKNIDIERALIDI